MPLAKQLPCWIHRDGQWALKGSSNDIPEGPTQMSLDFSTPIEEIVGELFKTAKELNRLYDELRKTASKIAGCPLDDWSLKTVDEYVKLANEFSKSAAFRELLITNKLPKIERKKNA